MDLSSVIPNRLVSSNGMSNKLVRALFACLLLVSSASYCQSGLRANDLKGFKYWQWESYTAQLDKTFVVRNLNGRITREYGDDSGMDGVFLQLKEPTQSKVIRTAQTGTDGRFHLASVPPGKYLLKIAARGWQTWVATVVVTANGSGHEAINVEMIPGS
jgi:hypothetical protein